MKKLLFLFLIFILVLFIGCATIPQVIAYPRDEIKPFIGKYLRQYGDPDMTVYGKNFETGSEYVEVHWHINDKCYQVQLVQVDGEWTVRFDAFDVLKGTKI